MPAPSVDLPARSVKGPEIIPTRIDREDGLKVVPLAFENCQLDDLIALIGQSAFRAPSSLYRDFSTSSKFPFSSRIYSLWVRAASMLDKLITHNDRIPLTPTSLTRFHSRAPPTISITSYLQRISRYTNVEPCCLLILLPYVDKVCARLPAFTISSLTVHRFVIAGVSVGSKALSDAFCTNGRYARVGGVSIAEMNLLEKEFCAAIDWRLTVRRFLMSYLTETDAMMMRQTTGSVLAHYYTSLVRSHPEYKLHASTLPINSVIPTVPTLSPPPPIPTPLAPAPPPADSSTPLVPVLSNLLPTPSATAPPDPPTPSTLSTTTTTTTPIDIDGPALIPAPESTGKPGSASNLPSPLGRSRRELLCSPTSNSYVDDGRHGLGLEAAFVKSEQEPAVVVDKSGGELDISMSRPGSSAGRGNIPSGLTNSRPPSNDSSPMVDSSPAATSSTRDSMKSQRSATAEEALPEGQNGMEMEEEQNIYQDSNNGELPEEDDERSVGTERNGVMGVGVNGRVEPD